MRRQVLMAVTSVALAITDALATPAQQRIESCPATEGNACGLSCPYDVIAYCNYYFRLGGRCSASDGSCDEDHYACPSAGSCYPDSGNPSDPWCQNNHIHCDLY